MKFRQDMLFGHPVLIREREDYLKGDFQLVFDNPVIEAPAMLIRVKPEVNSPDLSELIHEGKAVCGFYIICENTYFNRFIPVDLTENLFKFDAHDFAGAVRLRGVIVSRETIRGFQSRVLNPEFGERPDLPAASILALDDEQKFAVGQISKKPFESIFSLVADPSLPQGKVMVNPLAEKIQIYAHPGTKANIDEFRNTEAGRFVLLNAVYLPALMQLLHDVAGQREVYENKAWFAVFDAKCSALGVSLDNPKPLEDAQKLLLDPFMRLEEKTIKERLLS